MSGSLGSAITARYERSSGIRTHDAPPSIDFHTPSVEVPAQRTPPPPGAGARAMIPPPRGPTLPHCRGATVADPAPPMHTKHRNQAQPTRNPPTGLGIAL